ncbi:Gfo/Idh/MocA family protein [Anatilimnocola floriformis]|uniref:Gfo/Idh/MocA family protein n=1 Tax=Anatilimnocola floriformis TaxID=2948575 RepID=UPI0020C46567|nr:Gfo/Idh/MocA family oxidoreductase [Anatilimnocola floriformis]
MNRRRFLSQSLAGASAGVALSTLHARAFAAAGDKPKRVALIGSGWYGKSDLLRLVQVSPVEVVSLCDVDKNMVAEAAELVATRQASKKKPRTYGDYRELLKEKDVDIVLVDTPDHWHALPAIAAMEMGADVWVQKPIGVDIAEGKAMLDAARKHKRVVQVGTQRRSTPHLIQARDRIIKEGKLGKIALVEIYCYYHMRAKENPPDSTPPDYLDYEMWTGPAPLKPYNSLVHPRRWRAFNEYGNGIVGDMCVHMLDMVRWMMDLGWPQRIESSGGILVDKNSRANISDTQTATFDFGDLPIVWTHRSWGAPPDPQYPWGATFYGDKGTLRASVNSYDFKPMGGGQAEHVDVKMELEEFPEDKTEKDLEKHVAPAIRGHMKDFLACIESRNKPVADIEQGHISTTSCILANLSMQLGRSLTWDSAAHKIVNDDAANKLLKRPYRAPWKHPADA